MWPFGSSETANKPPKTFYDWFFGDLQGPDPRTQNLFMISGPSQCIPFIVVALYLFIFYKLVPTYQAKIRAKEFDIQRISTIINTICFIMNCIYVVFFIVYAKDYNFLCQPVSRSGLQEDQIAYLMYHFLLTKFVEFGDTWKMGIELSKTRGGFRDSEWTGHLFHHSILAIVSWIGAKFLPGGSAAIMAWFNSLAHTASYAQLPKKINNYVFGDTVVRTFHLVVGHISLVMVHTLTSLYNDCGFPPYANLTVLTFGGAMIIVVNCGRGRGFAACCRGDEANGPRRRGPCKCCNCCGDDDPDHDGGDNNPNRPTKRKVPPRRFNEGGGGGGPSGGDRVVSRGGWSTQSSDCVKCQVTQGGSRGTWYPSTKKSYPLARVNRNPPISWQDQR